MRSDCLRAWLLLQALAFYTAATVNAAERQQQQPWPVCLAAATLEQQSARYGRVEVPATSVGCRLVFAAPNDTARRSSGKLLADGAVIAGTYNGSLGRAPAVQIQSSAEDPALLLPTGGSLLLQGLLIANTSLADPHASPSLALLPSGLTLPAGSSLRLRDVQIIVSQQQLQQYIVFMLGIPSVVLLTDSTSYLFIRTYDNTALNGSAGSPLVVAHSVVLICPDGSKIKGMPLGWLQSMAVSGNAGAAAADREAVTAARGDAAGITTATDSYILGATNATLLPLLRQLARQQGSRQPFLVILASNVTLSPRDWRSAWPAAGLNITRQVVLVGSSSTPTSIDFGMEVGQVELVGQWANVTLFNIALENIAYGEEISGRYAEGNSILQPGQLWAFQYRRSFPQVVLWDCTLVLPGQRFVDSIVYWANAFNSGLEIWRSQAAFMKDTLRYTVLQYTDGRRPGEYVITAMQKADLRMFNTTLTASPVAAPVLPLPFNASIHQNVPEGMADIAVGPIYSVEGLALSLYNINKAACRSFVLLPSNLKGGVLNWGAATLNYSRIATGIPPPNQQQQQLQPATAGRSGTSRAAAGTDHTVQSGLAAARAAWGANLTAVWPLPGGQICRCPVQFQGTPMVDLGFVRRMFVLQNPSGLQPGSASGSQGSDGGSGSGSAPGPNLNPKPLLKFVQMGLKGLPQGDGVAEKAAAGGGGSSGGKGHSIAQTWTAPATAAAPTSSEATGSVDGSTAGGSSWVSELPADAYTHLLWFISRNVAGGDRVMLSNVTLIIPQPEAAQMAAAASAAVQAAGGRADQAVLSVVFPTTSGPLPVVYRSLLITNNVTAAGRAVAASVAAAAASTNSSSPAASSANRRHLLQAVVAAGAGRQQLIFCAGTLHGLGVSGRNVCMVAAADSSGLPPDYVWPAASRSGSSNSAWPPWKVAVLVLATVIGLLALALFAVTIVSRRGRRWQQRQLPQGLPAMKHLGAAHAAAGGVSGQGPCWVSGSGASSSPDGTTSRCGSSESLKAYSSALAQRLREWCPGRQHDGSVSDTAKAPHLPPLPAAGSAGAVILEAGGLQQQLQLAQLTTAGALQKSPGAAAEGSPVFAIARGGQLVGQVQGSSSAAQAALPQQPAVSTPQRLAGAINSVSAEMHSRRLTGQHSSGVSIHVTPPGSMRAASSLARLSSRSPPIATLCKASPSSGDGAACGTAAAAASSAGGAAGASLLGKQQSPRRSNGVAQQRQQYQQRLARLSIDEELTIGQQLLEQQQQATTAAELAQAALAGSAGVGADELPADTQQQQQPSSPSYMAHQQQQLQFLEVVGSGTFGVVYRAIWRGIPAAVKVMQLPSAVGGSLGLEAGGMAAAAGSRREQMAVMETALGASLSHPNIVQVYTYMLRPLGHLPLTGNDEAAAADASSTLAAQGQPTTAAGGARGASGTQRVGSGAAGASNSSPAVTGYELQLVMEYCPLGSLRAAIDSCLLEDRLTGRPHYPTVLSLALGVARAMHHLHCEGVLHGDLKAGNVLLKLEYGSGTAGGGSAASSAAPAFSAAAGAAGAAAAGLLPGCEQLVAKVADLGLACMLDDPDTHISGVHRGTLSHMSPELLLHGHASRASDVYAMGILLFEAATGLRAFADVPKALLGAAVVRDRARPAWPHSSEDDTAAAAAATGKLRDPAALLFPPLGYRQLAEACWAHEPQDRPTFEDVTLALEHLIEQEQQTHASLQAAFTPTHPEQQLPPEGATAAPMAGSVYFSVGEVVGNGQPPPMRPAVSTATASTSVTASPPAVPASGPAAAGAGQGRPSVKAVRFMPQAVDSRAAPKAAASPAGAGRPPGRHVSAAAAAVAAVLGVPRLADLKPEHVQAADGGLRSNTAGAADGVHFL